MTENKLPLLFTLEVINQPALAGLLKPEAIAERVTFTDRATGDSMVWVHPDPLPTKPFYVTVGPATLGVSLAVKNVCETDIALKTGYYDTYGNWIYGYFQKSLAPNETFTHTFGTRMDASRTNVRIRIEAFNKEQFEPDRAAEPVVGEPTVVSAPTGVSLPWPFSGLEPLVDWFVGAWNALTSAVGAVVRFTVDFGGILAGLPSAILDLLLNRSKDVAETVASAGGAALATAAVDAMKGTPEYLKPFEVQQTDWVKGALEIYRTLMDVDKYFTDTTSPSQTFEEAMRWAGESAKVTSSMVLLGSLIEGASLGQFDFGFLYKQWLEAIFGPESVTQKINAMDFEKGVLPRVEQHLNWKYQTAIPTVADLINMVVKEKITLDDFKHFMRLSGFTTEWSQLIWDAHFIAPAYGEVQRAIWRGRIKPENVEDYLKRVDLDPYYNEEVWKPLLEEIPPYSELVNQRVKEVITQSEFDKYIAWYGFNPIWAQRIWDAHFMPATFGDFLTAMRRKLSVNIPVAEGPPKPHSFGLDTTRDEEVIKELSVLADYDPRYWDFFKTRIYNDPSYRMIMWGFETGAIERDQIPSLVHRLGYRPEDEVWYTHFLTHFQERPWITKYLTALASAYINDAIDAAELERRVLAIPRNKEVADWVVKIADVRKEIAATKGGAEGEKLLSVTDLKKALIFGLLSEDNFRTELLRRGFRVDDIQLLIDVLAKENEMEEAGGKKKGLTVAEYFDAFRFGELTEEQLRTELLLKGLGLNEVDVLINTKKKKWAIGLGEEVS